MGQVPCVHCNLGSLVPILQKGKVDPDGGSQLPRFPQPSQSLGWNPGWGLQRAPFHCASTGLAKPRAEHKPKSGSRLVSAFGMYAGHTARCSVGYYPPLPSGQPLESIILFCRRDTEAQKGQGAFSGQGGKAGIPNPRVCDLGSHLPGTSPPSPFPAAGQLVWGGGLGLGRCHCDSPPFLNLEPDLGSHRVGASGFAASGV